jgi:hypothetical protein
MFKMVDPTNNPDGLCWTVVHTRNGETVCRTRFVEENDAREYANRSAGMTDCLIHIEGPELPNGELA